MCSFRAALLREARTNSVKPLLMFDLAVGACCALLRSLRGSPQVLLIETGQTYRESETLKPNELLSHTEGICWSRIP